MSSLKKNLLYNMIYQILMFVLPLLTAPYVSRILGADGLGTYSYIYSISYYFGLFGMLGIANHGNRSIALNKNDRNKMSQIFSNIYTIQLTGTLIALLAYIVFVVYIFKGNKIIAYINIIFMISYMLDISWFFFGMEQFKLTVTRNTIIKIMTVICTYIFVKNRNDLWVYTLILALGALFSQVYLWLNIRMFISYKKAIWKEVKNNLKQVFVLFIPAIAYSIYKVMDKIMLGSLTTVTQVGYFDNAEKIINIPVGLITAFGTVMMPRISTLIADNNSKQISIYNALSFKYFTMVVCAATFGLAGISDVLAPIYFGKEFTESAPLIAGLSFTLIFMTWANIIRTQYLIPNKKDNPYVISTVVGAVVNLVFNIIFIPRLQAVGTLISTLLAEFLVFFIQMIYVRKDFPLLKYLKPSLMFFPIGIIMGVGVKYVGMVRGTSISTLLTQLVIGAMIYIAGTLLYLSATGDMLFMKIYQKILKKRE